MQSLLTFVLSFALLLSIASVAQAQDGKVYEIRTYTSAEGKLPELLARFRNHTVALFEKHGIKNIGYWVPTDPELSKNTLIYIVEHQSMAAANKSWEGFRADPAWLKARADSEVNGRLAIKVESMYLTATDFSKLR
jgi:hypothetical protein